MPFPTSSSLYVYWENRQWELYLFANRMNILPNAFDMTPFF